MVMMAARNTTGTPGLGRKKPQKAYTILRPREKWTADEHDSFVHALLIFGRDWKTIERFVGTKTATQIRSHAQKYFLKAHKQGLAATLPPAQPRRAAVVVGLMALPQQIVEWASRTIPSGAYWPGHDDSFMTTANETWFGDCCLLQDGTTQLPLSPDDLRFAEVYKFVADVFGSGAPRSVEAQLQRLHGVYPVIAETILLVLRNLQDNLCA